MVVYLLAGALSGCLATDDGGDLGGDETSTATQALGEARSQRQLPGYRLVNPHPQTPCTCYNPASPACPALTVANQFADGRPHNGGAVVRPGAGSGPYRNCQQYAYNTTNNSCAGNSIWAVKGGCYFEPGPCTYTVETPVEALDPTYIADTITRRKFDPRTISPFDDIKITVVVKATPAAPTLTTRCAVPVPTLVMKTKSNVEFATPPLANRGMTLGALNVETHTFTATLKGWPDGWSDRGAVMREIVETQTVKATVTVPNAGQPAATATKKIVPSTCVHMYGPFAAPISINYRHAPILDRSPKGIVTHVQTVLDAGMLAIEPLATDKLYYQHDAELRIDGVMTCPASWTTIVYKGAFPVNPKLTKQCGETDETWTKITVDHDTEHCKTLAGKIEVHELGHVVGQLWDEYVYSNASPEGTAVADCGLKFIDSLPNCTPDPLAWGIYGDAVPARGCSKWHELDFTPHYRPSYSSIMSSSAIGKFNVVSCAAMRAGARGGAWQDWADSCNVMPGVIKPVRSL